MYSKVLSYQVKRWLDKNWNEQEELEKYITKLNIDWSKGWLMIDNTIIQTQQESVLQVNRLLKNTVTDGRCCLEI